MKPKVTIITAVYNQERFIERCIRSAFSQTITDWEMIVIDDFSTDRSFKLVKKMVGKDKRVRIIRHNKNWGVGNLHKTYNQALKLANAEVIALLEGDDWWPPDKLENQLYVFENKKVVLSYGDAIITSASGKSVTLAWYPQNESWLDNRPTASILQLFADVKFFLLVSTVMIRTSSLRKIGGFRRDRYFAFVDVPTWYAMALEGEFFYKRKILGYYRKHKNSSWIQAAEKTGSMLREELQKGYWDFIRNNKLRLNAMSFAISKKMTLTKQKRYISLRRVNKDTSMFINSLLFESKALQDEYARRLLKSSSASYSIKLFVMFLTAFPFIVPLMFFCHFKLKLLHYKFSHVRKYS